MDGRQTPRPRHLTPGNYTVPVVQQDGRAPGPVWTDSYTLSLTSTQDMDGRQTPHPGHFTPGNYPVPGGWVGPRAALDGCGKSRPHWDSIPGPSSP